MPLIIMEHNVEIQHINPFPFAFLEVGSSTWYHSELRMAVPKVKAAEASSLKWSVETLPVPFFPSGISTCCISCIDV